MALNEEIGDEIPEGTAATARGDRAQRHRDVMSAARAVLDEHGWDGFSIRNVARRAGVSAGAIYQWFSGKGEIWANLQRSRFVDDTKVVRSWSANLSPIDTVAKVIGIISHNHADLGRYRFEFVRDLDGKVPQYATDLTEAHQELSTALRTQIERIQGFATPPLDHAARISWLWAVGKGVGDHLVDSRFDLLGVSRDEFLDTTAKSVLAGLTTP